MDINSLKATALNSAKFQNINQKNNGFKEILQTKKLLKSDTLQHQLPTSSSNAHSLKKLIKDVVKNHQIATRSIKSFMTRTNYSPEKLLKMQYQTGVLFLREQMFCKTAELSANTFKNFTQMQI
jgi:hypothetical protein